MKSLHSWLAVPLRIYLGGVFIAASLYKIKVPSEFALSVATYQILPLYLINLMAITLPWIELIVGACLCLGYKARPSAFLCAGMLVVFMIAIASALYFDLRLSCGCFASNDATDEMSSHTLMRDFCWFALAVYLVVVDSGRIGLDGWLQKRHKRPQFERIL